MATSVFPPRELFAELPQRSFEDYQSFEHLLLECLNEHVFDFPPGYSWREALDWGMRHQIVRRDGERIVIDLS